MDEPGQKKRRRARDTALAEGFRSTSMCGDGDGEGEGRGSAPIS